MSRKEELKLIKADIKEISRKYIGEMMSQLTIDKIKSEIMSYTKYMLHTKDIFVPEYDVFIDNKTLYVQPKQFEFYIGIDHNNIEDIKLLFDDLKELNLIIIKEFDDNYYTYTVKGTEEDYTYFLNKPYIKSLNHYEV